MKLRAIYIFIIIFCFSCQPEIKPTDTLLQQLPQNATFFVKINNMTNFLSELKNSLVSKKGEILYFIDLINSHSNTLSSISTEEKTVLGFYKKGRENHNFVLITKTSPDFFDASRMNNYSSETLNYDSYTLQKYVFNDTTVFSCEKNGFQLLSSSQLLLENILRADSYNVNVRLKRLYDASHQNTSASLFINLEEAGETMGTGALADWTSLDVSLNQKRASLDGVAISSDSTKSFIDLFKGTSPLGNRTSFYAPSKTEAVVSFTFDDFGQFQDNQNQFLDRTKTKDTLFNTIEEIGIISLNKQKVVFLNSFGAEGLSDFLFENKTTSSTYHGSDINGFTDKDLVASTFNPLVENFESNYFTVLDNTFVFSETVEPLQTVISNYRNKSTFSETTVYTTAQDNFASESSILFVSNNKGIETFSNQPFLSGIFKDAKLSELSNHTFAAQLVADHELMHTHFLVSETSKAPTSNSTIPLFTIELDSDLAINPAFVKNHRNNKQEIVVQDQDNNLYLISPNGKVLWKKQLQGRIQGKIHQVDIYKNGRLQLAFCTNNEFLVIDRNGEDVPPFKIKFEGGNLNPLAVFDYENNREYRFVVTQAKKVFMYNNKAQIVDGFTFKQANSEIIKSPKHFRLANKDYLIFPLADQTLKILHRAGQERIKVNQKIDFSENDIFLYKNKFSVTNTKGILTQIDVKGKITNTNFNLNKDHGMYATSKTLVFMDDNILSIRGKKVELDLGVYTAPKIFYIYDKIYVAVTDIQNQKIHLYDSQAKPIPGFPVFGNSLIDMADMDNDKKLEIVAKDQDNSLIVYNLN